MSNASMIRDLMGWFGERFIYGLIRVFGRCVSTDSAPWLHGPLGTEHIGDRTYEEVARDEGLTLERQAGAGGLLPDFAALRSPSFNESAVDPRIRDFYEGTAGYKLDTWATTYFPARIALWLLVQTISRRVDQLNFPLDGLETARGITSEIVLLRAPDGAIKYTGWFRRLRGSGRAVYTGFYMDERIPAHDGLCVKVVFPMPGGNATVLLRPENADHGGLQLASSGKRFGDAGFYRVQQIRPGLLRVWRIRSLHERFQMYVEDQQLRCDHHVRFLGLRVLSLHYRIVGRPSRATAPSPSPMVADARNR